VTSKEYGKDVENSIQELLDELEIEGTIIKAAPRNKGAEIT
jgi:predicted sugar kinase